MHKKTRVTSAATLVVAACIYTFWPTPPTVQTSAGAAAALLQLSMLTLKPNPNEKQQQTSPHDTSELATPTLNEVKAYLQNIPSLAGSDIDGSLKADDNGQLVIDKEVKHLFDYFLSVSGEIPEEHVEEILALYAQANLPSEAATEAITLFQSYLGMKESLNHAMQTTFPKGYSLESISDFFEVRDQIREEHLGSKIAKAFYSDERLYDQYQLEKARLMEIRDQDKRNQALSQLEQSLLDPSLASQFENERNQHKLFALSAAQNSESLSAAEQYALWESTLGHEYAAARQALEPQLQQQREAWQRRVEDYKKQHAAIMQSTLSDTDKALSVSELQTRLFSASEIPRLKAKL
jgi:lipase chaperone LimK